MDEVWLHWRVDRAGGWSAVVLEGGCRVVMAKCFQASGLIVVTLWWSAFQSGGWSVIRLGEDQADGWNVVVEVCFRLVDEGWLVGGWIRPVDARWLCCKIVSGWYGIWKVDVRERDTYWWMQGGCDGGWYMLMDIGWVVMTVVVDVEDGWLSRHPLFTITEWPTTNSHGPSHSDSVTFSCSLVVSWNQRRELEVTMISC